MQKLALLSFLLTSIAIPANAQIITNINTTGKTYTGAAVAGSSGDYWNPDQAQNVVVSLLAPDGSTSTGLTAKFTNFPNVYDPGTALWSNSPDTPFPTGIVFTSNATPRTLSLSGFNPLLTYTLDVLTAANSTGRQTLVGLAGATTSNTTDTMNTADTTWIAGDEYAQFLNVSPDASGNFVVSIGEGPQGEGDLIGVQILQGVVVPEPSSYALMGIGLAILLVVMRKSNSVQV